MQKTKLKIAIITMDYPVGSETFVDRDIAELSRQGNDVHLFTMKSSIYSQFNFDNYSFSVNPDRKTFYLKVSLLDTLKIYIYWFFQILFTENTFINQIKLIYFIPRCHQLAQYITRSKYDVTHLYWGHFPSLVGLMIKKNNNKNKVSIFLGAYDLDLNLNLSKEMVKLSDFLWTHAAGNKKRLRLLKIPRLDDFNINYRGLDISKLDDAPQSNSVRSIDFLTVCRMVRGKGIGELIKVLSVLKARNIAFKQVFIGDGPMLKEYRSLVTALGLDGSVSFMGYQPYLKVENYMKDSKYFVLLSEKVGECLPNSIKEALLHGCYVVTARSNSIEELIINNKIGLVISQNDHFVITETLEKLLTDNVTCNKEVANQLLREKFDIRRCIEKYVKKWSHK